MGRWINSANSSSIQAWKRCMSLAQRCANMQQLKVIHAIFIAQGFYHNTYAISKLLAFCALSDAGDLSYASLIFSQLPIPNLFVYNTLIRAYSRSSHPNLALQYFNFMSHHHNLCPDHHTFPFVLIACANASWVCSGRQVHNWVVKNGLASSDSHIQTALIRFYAECKCMDDAQKVFDEIPKKDAIQCNVLISGYLRCDLASNALALFRDMMVSGLEPDEFCVTTGLRACAYLGALQQGRWIHEFVKRRIKLQSDVFVGTALVDMYAKCGCIRMAVEVFERMHKRNAFSWAAMICGFALNGQARKAISFLGRMQMEDKLRPDGVVLLGVLQACAHAGLKRKGQNLLDNMEAQFGVLPKHEHYSCVVDLLCRAGRLDEAIKLIERMPMKPLASVWGALLSGCRIHNNVHLAELAVKKLFLVEAADKAEEDGAYVQLSKIYLAAQKGEDARRIRKMISDGGLKKFPGCSALEINGEVSEFVSGDVSHPRWAVIYAMLDLIYFDLLRHHPWQNVTSVLRP